MKQPKIVKKHKIYTPNNVNSKLKLNKRPTPARNGKYQVRRTGAVDSRSKDKCLRGASHRHCYDVFKMLTMK
jgi:hypothetical protein